MSGCGGPPETYHKAEQLFSIEKYDSAMYYFDRLLPEDGEWLDSAKVMKKKCIDEMINHQYWSMFSATLVNYQNDTSIVNHGHRNFISEMKRIIDMDSMAMFYRIIDNNKSIPNNLFKTAVEYYEDKMLTGYEWESVKGMSGQYLYFVRETADDWQGKNEGNKMQAKSNKSKSGWTKNNVIYRNICYDSVGIYSMQPRVFQTGYYSSSQYFGKGGSMRFIGKDTVIVNYGGYVSSDNRVWFVRRDKLKSEPDA
jgi:hypothetical protein